MSRLVSLAAAALGLVSAPWTQAGTEPAGAATTALGRQPFGDPRDPPPFRALDTELQAQYDFGHAVFNTHWVPSGTPGAARRAGLGPLYNSESCDSCHNEGARGRGPFGDGTAPGSLVFQLETPAEQDATGSNLNCGYGHILNTEAVDGLTPEAVVTIRYSERAGTYPDGAHWSLRVPAYEVSNLRYGPLSPRTILKPRMAPPIFGAGLLEAVPQRAIEPETGTRRSRLPGQAAWQVRDGQRTLGRFGWEGGSVSVRDQTTKALSREMGVTSADIHVDDCTAMQSDCRDHARSASPEASDELLSAVLEFQRWLAVPAATRSVPSEQPVFAKLGCADCHKPRLPVVYRDEAGKTTRGVIAPYTDLRLHYLGTGLADVDLSNAPAATLWRTAPLWGIGHSPRPGSTPTLLHDGRARSKKQCCGMTAKRAQRATTSSRWPARSVSGCWSGLRRFERPGPHVSREPGHHLPNHAASLYALASDRRACVSPPVRRARAHRESANGPGAQTAEARLRRHTPAGPP